jgi:hypothetical protein
MCKHCSRPFHRDRRRPIARTRWRPESIRGSLALLLSTFSGNNDHTDLPRHAVHRDPGVLLLRRASLADLVRVAARVETWKIPTRMSRKMLMATRLDRVKRLDPERTGRIRTSHDDRTEGDVPGKAGYRDRHRDRAQRRAGIGDRHPARPAKGCTVPHAVWSRRT